MKKKLITLIIALFAMLSTTKIYSQGVSCTVGTSTSACTLTGSSASISTTSYAEYDDGELDFTITPYATVYLSSECESLGNPGGAGVDSYTDASETDYSDGLWDSYGTTSYKSGCLPTSEEGFVSISTETDDGGYAYLSATW